VVFLPAGFSVFALIQASLGIYGVVSYSVNQRTQEIGIRMALGASGGLLFGITPGDPVTFVGMLVTLTAVAATAGYLPACRASRIDPIAALRAE
jgi:ABC-type antimicrobial peptide transport system permease subunit